MTVICHWCQREVVVEDGERFHVLAPAGIKCPAPLFCDCGEMVNAPAGEGCEHPEQHPAAA